MVLHQQNSDDQLLTEKKNNLLIGSNDLDRKVHNEMMKDGLTRYLSWCTEDDNKICQSALNIPVTLEYNNTNNPNKKCVVDYQNKCRRR